MAAWHEVVAAAPELAETVHRFRLDVTEVVVTRVADDLLQIASWHAGRGLERRSRA